MTQLVTPTDERRSELTAIRESVRSFVDRELRPVVAEWERRQRFPRQVTPRMGALGYIGAVFPQEVGGSAMGRLPQCVIVEELARAVREQGGLAVSATVPDTIHEVLLDVRLLSTGEHIGRQGTEHEQQDEPKTECELVGNLQVGKPTQHGLSPDT